MPSGPKKRKAAKKKKENEAHNNSSSTNNNNSNNPQGNDDPRSQDEKDSDGGEVSSPASQDQHTHQHPFNDGNEESEKSDPSSVQSFANENKSKEGVMGHGEGTEKVGLEDNETVIIEREAKSEKTFEGQNVSFGHIESAKGLHDGNKRSSSSSSSSSDDEAQIIEKKTKEKTYDPVLDTSYSDEHKHAASLPEEVAQNNKSDSFGEANGFSAVETASKVDLVTTVVSVSEEVISVEEVEAVENSGVSDVVVSGLKDYEEQVLPISEEVVAVSLAAGDVFPKKNEDKVFPLSEENTEASSDVARYVINGNDHKTLTPSAAPMAETSNGSENIKDSNIPESSEHQPLVASAPRVAERTSWFSCCGLFDVITGSRR